MLRMWSIALSYGWRHSTVGCVSRRTCKEPTELTLAAMMGEFESRDLRCAMVEERFEEVVEYMTGGLGLMWQSRVVPNCGGGRDETRHANQLIRLQVE